MPILPGLTRDDGRRIGFVLDALLMEAISLQELHRWCEALLQAHALADLPDYLLDLMAFDEALFKVYRVTGFVASGGLNRQEELALHGVAALRGAKRFEAPVTKQTALRALAAQPALGRRFEQEFPFIALPAAGPPR